LWLCLVYRGAAVGAMGGVPCGGGRVGWVDGMGHLDWQAGGAQLMVGTVSSKGTLRACPFCSIRRG
jgi:hypothetical protein